MITIIDYGIGNIGAFQNVFTRLNIPSRVAKNKSDLENVSKIILPGVGSFDYAINQLNFSGMRDRLDKLVLMEKTPVLGICVGMQMMGRKSQEGSLKGLNWIDGEVLKFDESLINHRVKLPHMGWNEADPIKKNKLFEGLNKNSIFYFLHSFYFKCREENNTIAISNYGISFSSAISYQNIYGIQFHPEKSHSNGEKLLKNFALI